MKQTETNKLIAEFMGLKNHFKNKGITKILIDGNEHIQDWECYDKEKDILITPVEMKYHTSWDWLMPVIDKCYQEHMSKHIADAVMTCDKDKAYQAVVEFINKYNKTNN